MSISNNLNNELNDNVKDLNDKNITSIEVQYENDRQLPNKSTTESNDSDVIVALNPIINLIKRLGTWPQNADKIWQRLSPWNKLSLFILHFYSFDILIEYLIKINEKSSIFSRFSQITAFFRAFIVILIIDIRFFRHQKVLNLFPKISEFPTFSEEYSLRNTSKYFRNLFLAFNVFAIIQAIVSIESIFRQTSDPFMDLMFHKIRENPLMLELIFTAFKWICYLFLIFNECLNKLYFLSICLVLRNKIKDFNSFLRLLEQRNTICSADQIQQIYRMHSVLTSIVEGIDDNFSVQSFLYVFSLVINTCVKIQVIINGIKTKDFSLFSFILFDLFYLTLIFVSILLISSDIGEQDSGPVLSVTKIGENADIHDLNLQQLIQLLITKLNTPVMRMTGWNCFELNKSFMLTVMGALITYTVVILQIS